jgi:hypothetical protein
MWLLESLQWLAIAALAFFLLGAYRLIAVRPPGGVPSFDQAVGPRMAKPLPEALASKITSLPPEQPAVFGFVTQGCPACGALIASFKDRRRSLDSEAVTMVLVAGQCSDGFARQLAEEDLADLVIHDVDQSIFVACTIAATPYLVVTDNSGRVLDKRVASDVSQGIDEVRAIG